ncbi:hypothetical protein L596_005210 [Steinernema carpocapsae]|uniref:Uncharacterized protein n=1 Tax=Steinernema carpocapsae TaxID=34508 RepID=A0A4U8UZR2_STECR|nr:hypothetical protein L596_005210 [Steinernema carpocapsae]
MLLCIDCFGDTVGTGSQMLLSLSDRFHEAESSVKWCSEILFQSCTARYSMNDQCYTVVNLAHRLTFRGCFAYKRAQVLEHSADHFYCLTSTSTMLKITSTSAVLLILVLLATECSSSALLDMYERLQRKAMASNIVLKDQPIALNVPEKPVITEASKPLEPHLKKLRKGYKLPIHGLDVVTPPTVTVQHKPGQTSLKSAAHILNRVNSVLLRI